MSSILGLITSAGLALGYSYFYYAGLAPPTTKPCKIAISFALALNPLLAANSTSFLTTGFAFTDSFFDYTGAALAPPPNIA